MVHLNSVEIDEIYKWLEREDLPRCGENGTWVPTIDELQNKIFPYIEKTEKDYSIQGVIKARKLIAFLHWISYAGSEMEEGAAQMINEFVLKRYMDEEDEY